MKIVVVMTLVFAAAVGLNWVLLELFKQKSHYRAEHSLVGIFLLMGFFYLLRDFDISRARLIALFLLALIPCYLGTVFSDLDIRLLGPGGHRNLFFHSGLPFFLLLITIRWFKSLICRIIVAGFGIGLASHLLWDALDHADVRWIPGTAPDRLWLLINGLLCLVLARIIVTSKLSKM